MAVSLLALVAVSLLSLGVTWTTVALTGARAWRTAELKEPRDDPATPEREDELWRARERYALAGPEVLIGLRVDRLEADIAAALTAPPIAERAQARLDAAADRLVEQESKRNAGVIGVSTLPITVGGSVHHDAVSGAGSGPLSTRPPATGLPNGYVFYVEDATDLKYVVRSGRWMRMDGGDQVELRGGPCDGQLADWDSFKLGMLRVVLRDAYVGKSGDYPVLERASAARYRLVRRLSGWVGEYVP